MRNHLLFFAMFPIAPVTKAAGLRPVGGGVPGGAVSNWLGLSGRGAARCRAHSLEQGLYHILAERAKEIAGKKKLETKSFIIELRIDGTLAKGDLRVQHSWEESASNKTGVLARPKSLPQIPAVPATPIPTPVQRTPVPPTNPNLKPPTDRISAYNAPAQPPPTMPRAKISQAVPIGNEDSEEMTHVATRMTELYNLEMWRGGVRQNVVPIYQKEILIGRGFARIGQLRDGLAGLPWQLLPSATAMQPLIVGENAVRLALSNAHWERDLWVPAIRPPTVPQGTARLRASVSAAHTADDIAHLIHALKELA